MTSCEAPGRAIIDAGTLGEPIIPPRGSKWLLEATRQGDLWILGAEMTPIWGWRGGKYVNV